MAASQLRSTRSWLLRLNEMSETKTDEAVATERYCRLLGAPLSTDEAIHGGPPSS
jgi:hypothetical protein